MISGLVLRGPAEAAVIAGLVMLAAGVPAHDRALSLDAGSPSWAEPDDPLNPGPVPPVQAACLDVSGRDLDALPSIFDDLDPAAIWQAFSSPAPGSPLAAWDASPADISSTEFDATSQPAWSDNSGLLDADNLDALETITVPEPQAILLLGIGSVLLAIKRRRTI